MTNPFNNMTSSDIDAAQFSRFIDALSRHSSEILISASRSLKCAVLPVPVFEIGVGVPFWGQFVHDGFSSSRIILSRDLLFKHPWYAVEDVLRHELAHYLKNALHHAIQEPPHGTVFRQMCAAIGANPRASGTYPLLDRILEQSPDSPVADEPPVIRKIRKLLALAESPNEHEAHLALMKARELMERHDIAEMPENNSDNSNDSDPFVTAAIDMVFKSVPREEIALANLLSDFYDVRAIISPKINGMLTAEHQQGNKTITLSGRCSKVKIALYVRDYILRTMDAAWNALPPKLLGKGGARDKRDFRLGVLKGIRQTLDAQQTPPEIQPAIVLRREQLDDYYRARYPRIRTSSTAAVKVNQSILDAGKAAGRSMTIRQGLENPPAPRQLHGSWRR